MSKHTFEDFLMEQHANEYVGTKDCMVDDFNDWVQDLGVDEIIKYADKFQKRINAELLERLKITNRAIENCLGKIQPVDGFYLTLEAIYKHNRQVIAKAEGGK